MSDCTPKAERAAIVQGLLASWGRYLRMTREARGLHQADVAALANIDQTAVSRAEQGKGRLFVALVMMARALDVSIPELAAGAAKLDAEENGEEAA